MQFKPNEKSFDNIDLQVKKNKLLKNISENNDSIALNKS